MSRVCSVNSRVCINVCVWTTCGTLVHIQPANLHITDIQLSLHLETHGAVGVQYLEGNGKDRCIERGRGCKMAAVTSSSQNVARLPKLGVYSSSTATKREGHAQLTGKKELRKASCLFGHELCMIV